MLVGPLVALPDERADGRGRGIENVDPVLLDQPPEPVGLRKVGRAFVHHGGGAGRKRPVHDVAVARHPANIGRAPEGVFVAQVEDPFHGHVRLQQVAGGGVDNTLRFPGGARGIEHVERMFAIERLGGAGIAHALVERVPPVIPALLHDDGAAGAFQHDHVAHAGASGQRFVHRVLEPHLFAAPPGAVGRDHHLGFQVLDARLQGFRRESAEHHAVRDAQPRAGQQRHRQLRDHPHVNDGAVAGFEAAALQHVGEAAHQPVQFLVGDLPLVPRLAFPQDGHFVLAMRREVPVQAVIGDFSNQNSSFSAKSPQNSSGLSAALWYRSR